MTRRLGCQVASGHGKAYTMFRKLCATAAATAAIVAAAGTPAQAALLRTGACDTSSLSQPFAPYGDTNSYKLVPGGTFEGSLAGWSLHGAVAVNAGGGPQDGGGGHALTLNAGGWVQSPKTCANTSYPTFRFFVTGRGNGLSTMLVQVVYSVPLLGDVALPVGTVTLNPGWAPSLPMLTASTAPALLSNGTAQVALRFTQVLGSADIDGVYVDPRMR